MTCCKQRDGSEDAVEASLAVLGSDGGDAGDDLGALDIDAAVALAQRKQPLRKLSVYG